MQPPYLGGLCKAHSEEARARELRRNDALEALHFGVIDRTLPSDLTIRDELDRLRVWWRAACFSLNYSIRDAVLRDEAEAATSWCISLAQELVDAERASRAGKQPDVVLLNHTRQWVWERFSNLELGLMSNGVERVSDPSRERSC